MSQVTGWRGGRRQVFSTACLQRCQRNERGMRIRREKVPWIRTELAHFPGKGWRMSPREWSVKTVERKMQGEVPGIRRKAVHFPGKGREDGCMGGDNSICLSVCLSAIDLSSVIFEKCLVTKRMQNSAEDRGARKPSKCPESATPILGPICVYI